MIECRKQLVNNSPANHSAGFPPTKIGRFLSADKNRPIFDDRRQIFVGRYCRPILSADFYRSSDIGLRTTVWGKPSLHPTDIDAATVGDIVRFIKKCQILIKYPVTTGVSQGIADGPTLRSTGRCNKCPAPFGTWNLEPADDDCRRIRSTIWKLTKQTP